MRIEHMIVRAAEKGREESEDAVLVVEDGGVWPFFAAVVDGHGMGNRLDVRDFAAFSANMIEVSLREHPNSVDFPRAFDETQAAIERDVFFNRPEFGAVAGAVVCNARGMHVAHAGDVRLYARRRDERVVCITRDHHCENPSERERLKPFIRGRLFAVESHPVGHTPGGETIFVDRLHHMVDDRRSRESIIPTRGFGNPMFRPAFIHTPDVRVIDWDDAYWGAVFALCSDGAHRAVHRTLHTLSSKAPLEEHVLCAQRFFQDRHDDATAVFFRVEAS